MARNEKMESLVRKKAKSLLRDPLRSLFWRLKGRRYPLFKWNHPPTGLLFVCKGNICRSPFAHLLAETMVAGHSPRLIIASAGLQVKRPLPSPPAALQAAEAFQITMRSHVSQALDAGMLDAGTAIVAMEPAQVDRLREAFPIAWERIVLLPLFDPENGRSRDMFYRYHLTDPYGKDVSTFLACYSRIQRCLESMLSGWGLYNGRTRSDQVASRE